MFKERGKSNMFYGEYRHTIDSKGRLFIPAKLRERLGEEFIFSRGFDKCICVYPMEEWERFTAKLEELPVAKERHVRRFFYAGAYEGTVDSQGRVSLSQNYRTIANLEKDVVIVGNRSHLEVWSAEAWEAEQQFINNEEITQELIELGF